MTRYTYQNGLSLFENEVIAGGISTCHTYNEFLAYYRMLSKHSRPRETYLQSQKRASVLWTHVRHHRMKRGHTAVADRVETPTYTPVESDSEDEDMPNICPMCNEERPAADEDGHCSYECASGGGKGDVSILDESVFMILTIGYFVALGYFLAMIYYLGVMY